MKPKSIFFRGVLLILSILIFIYFPVCGILGVLFQPWIGLGAAVLLTCYFLIWIPLRTEKRLARTLSANFDLPRSLRFTIESAVLSRFPQREGRRDLSSFARVGVIPDPGCNVLVARSPFSGRGIVFVSRGLLDSLLESEVRDVLVACLQEARSPGLGLQTYGAMLAQGFVGGKWFGIFWENPTQKKTVMDEATWRSAVSLLLFLPVYFFFSLVLRIASIRQPWTQGCYDESGIMRRNNAMRAISRVSHSAGSAQWAGTPAYFSLYVLQPW